MKIDQGCKLTYSVWDIITNHTLKVYEDKWGGDVLPLYDSNANGVEIHWHLKYLSREKVIQKHKRLSFTQVKENYTKDEFLNKRE